ncbi:MAG TPA: hypothetical protein VIF57_26010 [Polyangia bacterium]|jgi:hypothetical protein
MNRRSRTLAVAAAAAALAGACVPDVGSDPTPASMLFDLTSTPPQAPQPTVLVINPVSKHIDFSLAGTPIPDDCSTQQVMPPAQCEFDQWLQTLNGFPSLTPASAPVSLPLDPSTLTLGTNVVVFGAAKAMAPVTELYGAPLDVSFDVAATTAAMSVAITPPGPWTLGEFFWMGVRGYANGIRDGGGGEVVGSPTMALLKQDDPLTCGAADPTQVAPDCAGFQVVSQAATTPDEKAAAAVQLFQLETIRTTYINLGGFDAMTAAGLPKDQTAVLWGFPIHSNSVPLLLPGTPLVPRVPAANQILIGVQGPVDPTTVSAFAVQQQNGPVVVMDLTAAAAGDLTAGFPPVVAAYVPDPSSNGGPIPGAIAIQAQAAFPAGHQIGVFITNEVQAPDATPLVASPVSVLLRLTSPLVDDAGHSTVSGVADADAAALEAGRQALAPLFDNPIFTPLTGVSRTNLVYCYAFIPTVTQ